MEILGYITAVLIGLSLGLIGGGGSILTVPVLVYMLNLDPVLATTYSLFIVGASSLVGAAGYSINKLVHWKTVILFGIPSIITVFIVRIFLLPAIPESMQLFPGISISKGILLLLAFAVLMVTASLKMIRNNDTESEKDHNKPAYLLIVQGLLVGVITGLLGAGGGFLIIPALVLINGLPMKVAIGSSLTIIAINSLFGFFSSFTHYPNNWGILIPFTGLAIIGIFAGKKLGKIFSGESLKKGFGWFVLIMGILIIIKETILSGTL
jgi:uncharacterized protein